MDSFTDVCSSTLASVSVQIAVLSSQATCNKIMFFWLEKKKEYSEAKRLLWNDIHMQRRVRDALCEDTGLHVM